MIRGGRKVLFEQNIEDEFFECETNGVISDSIVQNWTPSALDCYRIGCDCTVCPIALGNYSFKCKMNHIVNALLKTYGAPNENLIAKKVMENNNVA